MDREKLERYLGIARNGHVEAAFHGLIDSLDEKAIPLLEDAYRSEAMPPVRALLVKTVWNIRSPKTLDFLAEALQDPEPPVWKEALDGITSLASRESLTILESSRDELGEDRGEFREWVAQAIEDVTGRINE